MKIKDILDKIETTSYLTVPGTCALRQVARLVAENRQICGIYVVDEQDRLKGYLSLGVLIRSVIASSEKPHFYIRSLLNLVTSDKVEDVMEQHVLSATGDDDAANILDRMVNGNIRQLPVIDKNRRIIASLNILDVWGALIGK